MATGWLLACILAFVGLWEDMAGQTRTRKGQKRNTKGRGMIVVRGKDGKDHPPTSKVQGRFHWVMSETVNGKRKRSRQALKNPNGTPCGTLKQAEAARALLLAPIVAKDKAQRLRTLAAEIEAADQTHEIALSQLTPALTLAEAWHAFIRSDERRQSTGAVTLGNYQTYLNQFRGWIAEAHPGIESIANVSEDMAKSFARWLQRDYKPSPNAKPGLSGNSINKRVGFLRLLWRILSHEESAKLTGNPWESVKRREHLAASRRALTLDELRRVLEEAEGNMHALFAIGTCTGFRLGDACTLKWSEVDLQVGVIRRIPNKTKRKGVAVVVGIPPYLARTFWELDRDAEYVLPKLATQYRREPSTISKRIQDHFTTQGIRVHRDGTGSGTGARAVVDVGFHSLRHTFVTLHAEAGTPAAMLEKLAGHASPAMREHYTHQTERAAIDAALVLPDFDNPVAEIDLTESTQTLVARAIGETRAEELEKWAIWQSRPGRRKEPYPAPATPIEAIATRLFSIEAGRS